MGGGDLDRRDDVRHAEILVEVAVIVVFGRVGGCESAFSNAKSLYSLKAEWFD